MLKESRKGLQPRQQQEPPSTLIQTQASTPSLVAPFNPAKTLMINGVVVEENLNFDTNAYSSMLDVHAFEASISQ
jgi:hypothetical protein